MPGSSFGILRSSKRAPRLLSWTNSGRAFERPPAPTSWMDTIGLASPRAQQRSITSWQRRSISALSRWTDAKSKSSSDAPEAMDEAAPPPKPMSIAGPPSTTMAAPAGTLPFFTRGRRILPKPPAIMIGLW